MANLHDLLVGLLSQGPQKPRSLMAALGGISQPTLSRMLALLGADVVRLGAARAAQYALRDRRRGVADVSIHRINSAGHIQRLGVLVPVRPEGFVMLSDDGPSLHSPGLPWWLLDMRPQGFLGRAYAHRYAPALGLPTDVRHWSDSEALQALMQHGHDAVGNLLLGDLARKHFLSQRYPQAVAWADKGDTYARLAQQAAEGECLASSAAGEQPKFSTYAQTPDGPAHVLVKFSLAQANPVTQRWRDLLLAEHHALETLRTGGLNAAASWVHDHHGQRFLEVERFDRVGAQGRRGLVSLASLDAEFVGRAREPWPVLVNALVEHNVVHPEAGRATQALYAFGHLTGNTDMHAGNLSFLNDGGRPYVLAPAYDMLPMAFQPKNSGALGDALPALDLHPSVGHAVWKSMLPLAEGFVRRLRTDTRFSPEFAACISALETQLTQATRQIGLLG